MDGSDQAFRPFQKLKGSHALVTGSTRGIGYAIAEALLGAGVRVAVNGRSEEAAEVAARSLGPGAMACPADLRDAVQCKALVSAAVRKFGSLNILVNNAGVGVFKPFGEMSDEEWRDQIEVNLGAVFRCSRAALPFLERAGNAHIVNIGSLAGRHSFARGAAYNASKFGLVGLTEAMMLDARHSGVRVSLVMPGSVATGFSGRPPDEGSEWRLSAEDCASAVLQILSYPKQAHASRIELRPSRPPRR